MKLAYGIFYTNNIENVADFYKNVLELKQAFGDEHFIAFQLENGLLGIKNSTEEREIPGHQTVIISVQDIESLYLKMQNSPVTIYKQMAEAHWGKRFSILDPDGNKVNFVQDKND